jgi:transposase
MSDLFDSISKDLDLIKIGNDYSLKVLNNNHIQIYRYGILERDVVIKQQLDRRELVVDLVRKCGASPTRVAEALSISRQSIFNWLPAYDKKGIQGLINNSKDSWKKNPKVFGNKARQEEEERKSKKEESQKHVLAINFHEQEDKEEIQQSSALSDLFSETMSIAFRKIKIPKTIENTGIL